MAQDKSAGWPFNVTIFQLNKTVFEIRFAALIVSKVDASDIIDDSGINSSTTSIL
jgi:hypothetical protein